MRKLLILATFFSVVFPLYAQRASRIHINSTADINQALKVRALGGYALPYSEGSITHTPSYGLEFSYEFITDNKIDWPIHWRRPIIGIGAQGVNLGNNEELGWMFAIYPYIRWDFNHSDLFLFSMKFGAGVAGFTKTNERQGSYVGLIGNYSMDFQVDISLHDWLTFELGIDATNNGGFADPNSYLVMPYFSFGYLHRFYKHNSFVTNEIDRPYTKPLPYTFMVNISPSAGGYDNWKGVKGTLHTDIEWRITNCWATGLGLDGRIWQGGENDTTSIEKRFSVGLSWSNRFTMDRFHLIADWGFYLYDPERPFKYFYNYNPRSEKGWNYFRLGGGIRLYDNLYLQITVLSHTYHVDCTEFGLTYSIPIHHHSKYNKKLQRFTNYQVWHPDKDENDHKATIHNYIHRPIR